MSEPVSFPSTSPALGLPLLIAGQAQKEFFVNQALCILDALHPRAIDASLGDPPASPSELHCYRVKAPASGAWIGHEDSIAILVSGAWHYVAATAGMTVFDRAAGCLLVYRSGWTRAPAPTLPSGGAVIDVEARAALSSLIQSMSAIGLLSIGA